jgi:plasmid stability protein
MVDILVRNVDESVAARLKQMAEERGTSVQQVARDILTENTRIGRAELVKRIAERAARMPDPRLAHDRRRLHGGEMVRQRTGIARGEACAGNGRDTCFP